MWSSLVVLHTNSEDRKELELDQFFSWHTCMRSIYVGDSRLVSFTDLPHLSNYSIYTGYHAYRFLLEVSSGIHSKLFGESEIQSQFRDRFAPANLKEIPVLSSYLLKLRDQILEQSRAIRSEFFTGHGRQTYGGIADSILPSDESVALLGTGNLSESMITHLKKKNRNLTVVGRNSEKLKELREKFDIETSFWEDYTPGKDHIVIAAPVDIQDWLGRFSRTKKILDFRGEGRLSCNNQNIDYTDFQEIIGYIKDTEDKLESIRGEIHGFIDDLVQTREEEQYHMPHGWEDLVCFAI
jgi:glutamyl-tRNA reductase